MSKAKRPRFFDEQGHRVAANSAYAQRFNDLKIASRQVGDTAERHLAWLVHFANQDSSSWHSATRAAHGDCLLALTGFAVPETCLGGLELPAPLPPEDIDETRAQLARFFRALVTAPVFDSVFVSGDGVSVGLVRLSGVSRKPAIWGLRYRFTSPSGVLYVARDLVLQAGDRLVACRLCHAPLVAVGKQEFCNAVCAQKYRNDKKAQRKVTAERTR